jgi:hypothetical protein
MKMDITDEVKKIIGQIETETLEYKAVLPPSRSIAQSKPGKRTY